MFTRYMHVFKKDNFLPSDLILQMSLKEPSQPRNRSKNHRVRSHGVATCGQK